MIHDTFDKSGKRKIHPVAADGSSRLVVNISSSVLAGTDNILSHRIAKSNDFKPSYEDVCRWIIEMLDAKEDVAIIIDQLYKTGVIKYIEWRAIYDHLS